MRRLAFFTPALVIALTFILFAPSIHSVQAATTYYVDDYNCPGPGSGTQADPFCSIQSGIDAASSGDTVQVAAGTYNENITMKSGVVIQGAGQGVSIIDGGASGSVVTAIGVDSAAKLDGFTITNGKEFNGGGMYNSNSSPTVSNCTFAENSAFLSGGIGDGGGMYNLNSSPTVTNCTFSGNDAGGSGGGMYNSNSSPTVTICTFSDNTAYQGGGMYNLVSSPAVTSCTFSGNSSANPSGGGGMYNYYNSSPTVSKCSFYDNVGGTWGGGMYNYDNSSPIVTNCIFSGNMAPDGGGGIANLSSSPTVTNCTFSRNVSQNGGGMYNWSSFPTLTNCTFWRNTGWGAGMCNEGNSAATVTNSILWETNAIEAIIDWESLSSFTYCDILQGNIIYPGTGNFNADPMFVDPDGPDNIPGNEDDDLHLTAGSPCIDAGDNSAPALPTTDIDGDNRRIDHPTVADTGNGTPPIVDMGADEYVYVREVKAMPWLPLLLLDD